MKRRGDYYMVMILVDISPRRTMIDDVRPSLQPLVCSKVMTGSVVDVGLAMHNVYHAMI